MDLYAIPHFGKMPMSRIAVRDVEDRDIDIPPPLLEVLKRHRALSPPGAAYVFTSPKGAPLDVNNLRKRTWYPTRDGKRRRRRFRPSVLRQNNGNGRAIPKPGLFVQNMLSTPNGFPAFKTGSPRRSV